jgi:hypothetical protein
MSDKPRQRSVQNANNEVNRDPKDRERDAERDADVNQMDDPTFGEKTEDEKTLLEELAEYEPRIAYD